MPGIVLEIEGEKEAHHPCLTQFWQTTHTTDILSYPIHQSTRPRPLLLNTNPVLTAA